MKKLIIITNMFPWGKGERSFISPELEYLKNEFKVTILSRAPMNLRQAEENMAELPEGVSVVHYPEPELSKMEKLCYLGKASLSKEFRKEIKEILRTRRGLQCIKETYFFWIRAVKFLNWMKKRDFFKETENTIFYSYWANYSVYSLAMEKQNNPSVKFVSRMHGYDLYNERFPGGRQPFKEYVDKRIDKIFFIAKVGYEYYIEHFSNRSRNNEKYIICKMGVKKPERYPEKISGEPFRLVSCSAVSELKRVDVILKALEKINGDIEWHHFGDGPCMETLKKVEKQLLGNKNNVKCIFHGHIKNEELMNFYNDNYVDCFITTSSSEGCPVSIQEALSYGIPIIGTDVGEIRYMIKGNGKLLPVDLQAEDTALAIQELMQLGNSEMAVRREQALAIWQRDHQLEQNTMTFINMLKKL